MSFKTTLKWLLRSRSVSFVRDRFSAPDCNTTLEYHWHGAKLRYRPGTSDQIMIYEILLKTGKKGEYWLPDDIEAEVILDIGANIGIASTYLAARFPKARIFAFEPVPANFAILKENVAQFENVRPFPVALGPENGSVEMFFSASESNLGGFSFYGDDSNVTQKVSVVVRSAESMMRELALDHADVIKIDTEGAEYDIITSLHKDFLSRVKWIYGELHGNRDFELLAYLSEHFDIGVKRTMGTRHFMFQARNKTLPPLTH
jgi:FkbM family methyltransferase